MYGYGFGTVNRLVFGGGAVYPASLRLFYDVSNDNCYPDSGTAITDLTTNDNDGTLINGVLYSASNGGILDYDGTNDYIDFGTNKLNYTEFTCSHWINVDVFGNKVFFQNANFSTNYYGYKFWTLTTGRLAFNIYDGNPTAIGGQVIMSGLIVGTWYHVTFRKTTGGNMETLLNGVLHSTTVTTNNPDFGSTMYNSIGCQITAGTPSIFFNGKLAQHKFYSELIADVDILADFNDTKSNYGY